MRSVKGMPLVETSDYERLGDAARASKLLLRWLGDHLLVRP